MRVAFLALALALPATGALAQVQQNDPNAANASLARQGEARAVQQQRVSDFNTLNMQMQRNVQFTPPEAARGPYGLRRSGARGGGRRHGGFNSSVCTGC